MTADDNDEAAIDGGDAKSEPDEQQPADGDNPIGRANIEKFDAILDEAGVNEGIAAGSREAHPDEG